MKLLYPSEKEIRTIFRKFRGARIGVLGDFCLDAYWVIDPTFEERSVETGKSIRHVREQRYSPGGAGNTVVNLLALGVKRVAAFGIIGPDPFGRKLWRTLGNLGADTDGLVTQAREWDTHVYCKPLVSGEEMDRIDFGTLNTLADDIWRALLARLRRARRELDFLIVNQQIPRGWCDEKRGKVIAAELQSHWRGRHLVDTRDFAALFDGLGLKLNEYEAMSLVGRRLEPGVTMEDGEADALARKLASRGREQQFLTRGARGILVCDRKRPQGVPGILILGQTDPVGAGDTVTAMLSACLASRIDPLRAACLANLAASVTVQKINQTGTATEAELIQAAHQVAYVYRPSLADEPRLARRLPGCDVEVVEEPPRRGIRFAVFDHDGTVSTLRQEWEKVMEPVMIRSILGPRYGTVDAALFRRVQNRARDFIEQTTGIQTILQMDGLVAMVKEFGIVPERERLDALGYKAVYNQALMTMVDDRVARLERGELEVADFVMKGAIEFLNSLVGDGITLFLASGTDEEDVRREARVLGYAHLFRGGIFGAKKGSRACSKEQVIEDLLRGCRGKEGGLLVLGDGPVEIRQGRRHDAFCIGVASHEERRFGLNESKRRRLIRAGAHLVVPDFSQRQSLLAAVRRVTAVKPVRT